LISTSTSNPVLLDNGWPTRGDFYIVRQLIKRGVDIKTYTRLPSLNQSCAEAMTFGAVLFHRDKIGMNKKRLAI
jgi:hypothetical protein